MGKQRLVLLLPSHDLCFNLNLDGYLTFNLSLRKLEAPILNMTRAFKVVLVLSHFSLPVH